MAYLFLFFLIVNLPLAFFYYRGEGGSVLTDKKQGTDVFG
jgi:hypothetical protein